MENRTFAVQIRFVFLKPQFIRTEGTLIKATAPFQRLSVDFKGPLPQSNKGNQYLFTIIDEYSRFPFAYACRDMTSKTVVHCFNHLFSIFGMPDMVHSDRATDFLSTETTDYLLGKSIAYSNTSRYNPQGNGQVEKLNETLWKAIQVTLHSRNLKSSDWEQVLPDALHSIRSLLCTATNETPHERLFNFTRKSTSGKTVPSWVKPGPILVRNQPKRGKNDPPVVPATLLHANPQYAHVRLQSGRETTVNLRDVSRHPEAAVESSEIDLPLQHHENLQQQLPQQQHQQQQQTLQQQAPQSQQQQQQHPTPELEVLPDQQLVHPDQENQLPSASDPKHVQDQRRSKRVSKPPSWFGDFVMS